MSESDSDLDYESADDDTSCDISVKNDTPQENSHKTETKSPESSHVTKAKSSDSSNSELKSEIPDSGKEIQTGVLQKERINVNTETTTVGDSESAVNESKIHLEDQSEGDSAKNNLREKQPEKKEERDKLANKVVKESAATDKVHHEKQRVPLRLEKKIQQKQQMSKEGSIEAETSSNTEKISEKPEIKSSSWGFGSWGTNLLSTAASSVTTFTNQVSQGIGTVLESVESTLGAPSPEELATTLKEKREPSESSVNDVEKRENDAETKDENSSEVKSGILPDVSSWTKVLENTGSRVIMGGLDTLELIGKKTIDIITEGDPGLRKKRAALDGISLSQILREAKAEADESKQDEDSTGIESVHYSQLFDEYQGLVHLEALEMLSKQSEAKIQMLLMKSRNPEIRKNLEEIKSICENIPPVDETTDCENFEDFLTVCKKYVLELNLTFNVENIIKAHSRMTDVLKNYENARPTTSTPEEIYHSAICSLAEFTAKSIEAFHKFAELILVQATLEPNVEHYATNLTGLTTVICIEINNLSSRYHQCLDSLSEQCEDGSSEKSNITAVVTNLYLEASNSNKYIQDAFLLLVPVLQVSLLESLQ